MNNGKWTAECVSWHMATEATLPARLSGGSSQRFGTLTMIDPTETGPRGGTMTEVSGDASGAAVANGSGRWRRTRAAKKAAGGGIFVK